MLRAAMAAVFMAVAFWRAAFRTVAACRLFEVDMESTRQHFFVALTEKGKRGYPF